MAARRDSGPLTSGVTTGEECVPVRPGGVVSYGFEVLRNTGRAAAVITKIGLASASGLRILQAWAVPIRGHTLYGVLDGYPPYPHLPPGVEWASRQNADGAIIPRSQQRQVTNLVLVLKPTKRTGWAAGVQVYYSESGRKYYLQTHISIRLARSCA